MPVAGFRSNASDACLAHAADSIIRFAGSIEGIVQGVGFRPFVYRLAAEYRLCGFVRNQQGGVTLEVEGMRDDFERFAEALKSAPPSRSQINRIVWHEMPPTGEAGFHILASHAESAGGDFVPPDIAVCDQCLLDLQDPSNRRHGYAFTTCAQCGPRLSIIEALPYDRARTTMSAFPMCADCLREYEDPRDRRFHAESIACPACGPRVVLRDAEGGVVQTSDPVATAGAALLRGAIVAVKGVGGFHLVCDARDASAVATLRRRKQRDEKPLAVLLRDLHAVESICMLEAGAADWLASPARPIVLLMQRRGNGIAPAVAPGNPMLGVLLPYTPLHHLLVAATDGAPLVVTSANLSESPILFDDVRAMTQLQALADLTLTHDRKIHLPSDDSVVRLARGRTTFLRRSRGYTPVPLSLPIACPVPTLALGGQMKNTFALGRGTRAVISHHLGDLDGFENYAAFVEGIQHFERLYDFAPSLIMHDLHPDYTSTRYALERHANDSIPCLAVQHHHAHIASGMAEHGLNGPVIGICFDGTGYGTDGTVWGGEFLLADYTGFERVAHLRQVPMPGGSKAIQEPWRMALAHLIDAGLDERAFFPDVLEPLKSGVAAMCARGVGMPLTSSCGRLFDAVAALLGLCSVVHYEGQAAMALEWLAMECPAAPPYDTPCTNNVVDTRSWIVAVAQDIHDGVPASCIARRFHQSLVESLVQVCQGVRTRSGVSDVVLSGGVFANGILATASESRLRSEGFNVFQQNLVPAGDGGLSLGQLAIAAAWKGADEHVPCDTRKGR